MSLTWSSAFASGLILLVAISVSLAADGARKVAKRSSSDDDIEALLLESLQNEYNQARKKDQLTRVYESRGDVFDEKRWREVYADLPVNFRTITAITPDLASVIVNLHNQLRAGEGSSNMEMLHYNDKLAGFAQQWSARCVFEHGQPGDTNSIGYKTLGQNIYAHSDPSFKVQDAVNAWFNEKSDWNHDSASCNGGKVCGHYTAVSWAQTTDVGCGITFCPSISGLTNAHFIVCNYAPAGNFQGHHPFLKGPACTQCDSGKFFCNNNLCDHTCTAPSASCQCKAACKHCGTANSDCTCTCIPGFTGPDCSRECKDMDHQCGKNPGYPDMLCSFNDPNWAFVKDKCPLMCKKCRPRDSTPCNQRDGEANNDRKSVLKHLMLSYLEKELKQDNARNAEK